MAALYGTTTGLFQVRRCQDVQRSSLADALEIQPGPYRTLMPS
ncbi:MAG: hypothetical protein ABIX37_05315 [Gammaproteobacteria bacterium]